GCTKPDRRAVTIGERVRAVSRARMNGKHMPPIPRSELHNKGAAVGAKPTPSHPIKETKPRTTGIGTVLSTRDNSHGIKTPPRTLNPPSTARPMLAVLAATPASTKIAGNHP